MNLLHKLCALPQVLMFAAGLAAAVLMVAFQSLHLSHYDLRVPFTYSEGDCVVILMYIKGLIQDGWPTIITHVSAPFDYPGAAFPILTSTDWLVMKLLSVFTAEPGYILNGFWLLTLVFSAWTTAYATYQLGLSQTLSFVSGVIYAFLPFALIRNVHHLNLVYYVVPLLCLLAVVIASGGKGVRDTRQATLVGLLACIAQGFDYIYYSFFAVLLFGIAVLISYQRGNLRLIKLPLLAMVLVTLSTAVNLYPTLQSWRKEGSPPEMGYKSVVEAEIYGAKIRRMLSPHPDNPLTPLAKLAQKDFGANFPNENENVTARLGLYGAFGLLLMIVFILRRGGRVELPQPIGTIAPLGLATLLIITVGGFGVVINLITVPDIRAYNRFSVYLSFFATAATGLWLREKFSGTHSYRRMVGVVIVGGFVLLSLYDQLLDAKPILAQQHENMLRARQEQTAVAALEQIFPNAASVLELPLTGFPPQATFNNMASYDHGRPYIWSHHVKWSWPSFSQRHREWQTRLGALQGDDLIRAAIFSGFDAIWIDRAAYKDEGRELVSRLSLDKVRQVDIGSSRFAVLDIRTVAANIKASMSETEFNRHASEVLGSGAVVEWKRGFYDEERSAQGRHFRWVKNEARMVLHNPGDAYLSLCIKFEAASPQEGVMQIEGAGPIVSLKTSAIPQVLRMSLEIAPGEQKSLLFSSTSPRHNAPGDQRDLHFYVMDFDVSMYRSNVHRIQSCNDGAKQ